MVEATPPQAGGEILSGFRDVFERPFTDFDDPRLKCAQVLTRAEAKAILEHSGDLRAALSPVPSPVETTTQPAGLTAEGLDELERLALAATPGEDWSLRPVERLADAEFIAALSPATALRLITDNRRMASELRAAREDKARLDWLWDYTVNVRVPLVHGSRDLFWAKPDRSFAGVEGPSDIRAKIDAARTASEGRS